MLFPPVRLSRCLIRTANGASSARGGMPSHLHQQQPFSLPCGSRNKQGTPFRAASSRDPKNLGQVCRSLRGGAWPEDLCMSCLVPGPLASQQGTLSGRLGSLVVPWPRPHGGKRGALMAPRSATHLSLSPQPQVAFHFLSMKSWKI